MEEITNRRRQRRLKKASLTDVLYARKVSLFRKKKFKRASVKDISTTGIGIWIQEDLPIGTRIEVIIYFSKYPGMTHPPLPIRAEASVVYCQIAKDNKFLTGIAFTRMGKQETRNLHVLLDLDSLGEDIG